MSYDVNSQVTDGLTQTNLTVLGSGPSLAIVQSAMSLAQAQGVLFANMISNQQQLALSSNAAMTEGIMQLYAPGGNGNQSLREEKLAMALGSLSTVLQEKLSDLDQTLATS